MEIKKIPTIEEFDLPIADDEVKPLKELVDENDNKLDRFNLGFKQFDEIMNGGFKHGDLVIVSGISGEGKTTYAQTLTYNLCLNGLSILWFSYECSVNHLNRKFEEMGIADFYHVYHPKKNTTGKLAWIKSKIREGWIKYGTNIVFIDHLDFLTPSTVRTSDNEAIALKKIVTELKALAIELDVVIVTMAHLKKISDGREPEMQDIGYSAGIFQLADYVFLVMREKNEEVKSKLKWKKQEQTGDLYTNNSIIKLVKNRETGTLKYIKTQYANGRYQLIDKQHEFTGYNQDVKGTKTGE